jgi:hypothetical protein
VCANTPQEDEQLALVGAAAAEIALKAGR